MKPIAVENVSFNPAEFKLLFFIFFLCFCDVHAGHGQCLSCPVIPACNTAGSSELVNNDVVSAGQVKNVTGNSNFTSTSINGGTLIVCGTLTINSFTFTSGDFIVRPGGVVQINMSTAIVFGTGCRIFNHGMFTITGSIVTGQNNIIANCATSSVFNVAFNQLVIQGMNTYVVNNGILNSSYVIVQSQNSPAPVCSGIGSAINTNVMINQYANAFTSPAGPSCINISQYIINSQPMTATSSVVVCYNASNVNVIGATNFGSATVNNACPGCAVALPVDLKSFSGTCMGDLIHLMWKAENGSENDFFEVQGSEDAMAFQTISIVDAIETSSKNYHFDYRPGDGRNFRYFRLILSGERSSPVHSPVIYSACGESGQMIFSQFSAGSFIALGHEAIQNVDVFDASGRLIKRVPANLKNSVQFSLEQGTFAGGIYLAIINLASGKQVQKKLILN